MIPAIKLFTHFSICLEKRKKLLSNSKIKNRSVRVREDFSFYPDTL